MRRAAVAANKKEADRLRVAQDEAQKKANGQQDGLLVVQHNDGDDTDAESDAASDFDDARSGLEERVTIRSLEEKVAVGGKNFSAYGYCITSTCPGQ